MHNIRRKCNVIVNNLLTNINNIPDKNDYLYIIWLYISQVYYHVLYFNLIIS